LTNVDLCEDKAKNYRLTLAIVRPIAIGVNLVLAQINTSKILNYLNLSITLKKKLISFEKFQRENNL